MTADADALIRRRHVLYVEGYDPQGAEGYHNLFQPLVQAIFEELAAADIHR